MPLSRLLPMLLAALCLLAGPAPAYDLAETDGDDTPGNAPILLGWESQNFPLAFALDTVPPSVATTAAFRRAVFNGWSAWQGAAEGHVGFVEVGLPGGAGLTTAVLTGSIILGDCNTGADCTHLVATVQDDWAGLTSQPPATVAVTVLKFDTGTRRIVDADVLFNNQDHQFNTNGDALRFDLEGVSTHEFGHVLGLGHPADASRRSSTMWPETLVGDTSLRSLETDDANGVLYLYAPLEQVVPGPDNNVLGLVQRAVTDGTGGSGGCRAYDGGDLPGAEVLLLLLLMVPWRRRVPGAPSGR